MAQYCYYNGNTASPIHRVSFNGSTFRKVAVSLSNTTKTYTLETWYSYTASAFPYSYTDYELKEVTNTISANYTYYYYSGQARYSDNYQAWDTPYHTYPLSFYSYKSNNSTIWGYSISIEATPVFNLPNFFPFTSTSSTYHWANVNNLHSISRPIDGRFSVLCSMSPYAGGTMSVTLPGHGEETWQPMYATATKTALATTFTYSLTNGITKASEFFTELRDSYRYSGTKATFKHTVSTPTNNSQYFTQNTF